MILVTVGNHVKPFDRLIKGMDELAGQIDEEVIMQTGHAPMNPNMPGIFGLLLVKRCWN
jgi:beta-1,4-N-acetylglucosaminyltransferase